MDGMVAECTIPAAVLEVGGKAACGWGEEDKINTFARRRVGCSTRWGLDRNRAAPCVGVLHSTCAARGTGEVDRLLRSNKSRIPRPRVLSPATATLAFGYQKEKGKLDSRGRLPDQPLRRSRR